MKVIDQGHCYELDVIDGIKGKHPDVQKLVFVKREGEGYPGNISHYPGTNLQEVIRVCIDRIKYLSEQAGELIDHESVADNQEIIVHLRSSLYRLERRAARRHRRKLNLDTIEMMNIEILPTCKICGHIKPENHNHSEKEITYQAGL